MRPLFLLVLLTLPIAAQERTHTVVPADYFTLNSITEIAVSPDGKHVAYTLAVWDKTEDARKADLWVIATDGKGKPTRLTFDRANDRHLRWSVDGKAIYALGNRKRAAETKAPYDGTTQVWRVDASSGDTKAITREAGGVAGYDYAPKAEVIVFGKEKEHQDEDEFAKLRAKTKVEYGHGVRKVSELHQLDLPTWRTEKLVDDTRYIREFTVTADGKKIAMVTAFDDTVVKSEGESRVDILEPRPQGSGYQITTPPTDSYRKNPKNSPYAWLENLCWNPDGTRFAFTAVHDAFPAEVIVGTLDGSVCSSR
jgi:Tol biopolymer transport system component